MDFSLWMPFITLISHIPSCSISSVLMTKTYEITEPDDTKFYCNFCDPGTYWTGNCVAPNPISTCTACPKRRFQNTSNKAHSCAACRDTCPYYRQVVVANCTSVSDLECQCDVGYYWSNPARLCLAHDACEAGSGVVAPGTPQNNTNCEACRVGHTFSPNSSLTQICQPCSECHEGLREKLPCTRTNDTVCDEKLDGDGWSTGAIVALVLGVIGLAIIIGIIACICKCDALLEMYKKAYTAMNPRNGSDSPTPTDNTPWMQKYMPDKGIPMTQTPDNLNTSADNPIYDRMSPQGIPMTQTPDNLNTSADNPIDDRMSPQGIPMTQTPDNLNTRADNPIYDRMSPQVRLSKVHDHVVTTTTTTMAESVESAPTPSGRVSDEILRKLSEHIISPNWQFFIRCLFHDDQQLDQSRIDAVIQDNPHSVREQIYKLLLIWREQPNANLDDIIHALGEHGRPDLVEKYRSRRSTTV